MNNPKPKVRIIAADLIAALAAYISWLAFATDNRAGGLIAMFALVGGIAGILGVILHE